MFQAYLLLILISYTLAQRSSYYPPSGYRPSGAIFELPKRPESFQLSQPHTEYGVPKRQYDPSKSNINNEYSYSTINLPQNQYGSPLNEVKTSRTNYISTTKSSNSQYNQPQTYNRFPQSITQQQLPKLKASEFRNSNFLPRQNQYGTPNNNQNNLEIVPSIDITTTTTEVNYNQPENRYNAFNNFNNRQKGTGEDNIENQYSDSKNQPRNFYNSPDKSNNEGIDVKTPDVDIRFRSNGERRKTIFNRNPAIPDDINNGESGSGAGNLGQDGYYNNPTIQPEEKTITTTTTSPDYVIINK